MWERLKVKAAVAGMSLLVAGSASAALDSAVTDAIDSLKTDGLALIAAVTVVVIAFVAPSVIIKLIKRFTAKV
jgi:Phage major coat protein, Gp8